MQNLKESIVQISETPFILSYAPSDDDGNMNGVIHGGILFYLCDEAIGRYVTALDRKGAAADANIHFYRPARLGESITIYVTERKCGKRLGTYLVELKNGRSELLADALFTVAFL